MPYTGAFSSEFATVLTLGVPKNEKCGNTVAAAPYSTKIIPTSIITKIQFGSKSQNSAKHPHINSY
jgi:hypothetical protein